MARDAAVVPQTLHLDGSETLTPSAEAPLAVEDAGDLLVGVVNGQAAQQVDGVLIGLDRGLGVAAGLVLAQLDHDFLDEQPHQLLAVSVGGGGRVPDELQVAARIQTMGAGRAQLSASSANDRG